MPRKLTDEQRARYNASNLAKYYANRETILAKISEYGKTDAVKARRRARYASNPKRQKQAGAAYYRSLTPEQRAARKAKADEWRRNNREKERARKKAWRLANPEKARASVRNAIAKNPEKHKERNRKYAPARAKHRYATDPRFRVERLLRARLRLLVKRKGGKKAATSLAITGASFADVKEYLERLFQPGMTWQNHGYGPGKWNIDHIRRCASFDLRDPTQQRACFHYSNLQPMWHEENAAKGDRY